MQKRSISGGSGSAASGSAVEAMAALTMAVQELQAVMSRFVQRVGEGQEQGQVPLRPSSLVPRAGAGNPGQGQGQGQGQISDSTALSVNRPEGWAGLGDNWTGGEGTGTGTGTGNAEGGDFNGPPLLTSPTGGEEPVAGEPLRGEVSSAETESSAGVQPPPYREREPAYRASAGDSDRSYLAHTSHPSHSPGGNDPAEFLDPGDSSLPLPHSHPPPLSSSETERLAEAIGRLADAILNGGGRSGSALHPGEAHGGLNGLLQTARIGARPDGYN